MGSVLRILYTQAATALAIAVEHASTTAIDGLANFFGKLVMPSVEELGLYGKDYIAHLRKTGMRAVMEKAKKKIEENNGGKEVHAPPRVVVKAIESSEWITEGHLQDMWAGLIASACTPDGEDESNFIYIDYLASMTTNQALLLRHVCEDAELRFGSTGQVMAVAKDYSIKEIKQICKLDDFSDLMNQTTLLDTQGIVQRWYDGRSEMMSLGPTPLALSMYVRCQGSRKSPLEYFGDRVREVAGDESPVESPGQERRLKE